LPLPRSTTHHSPLTSQHSRVSTCFVALNAWPVIDPTAGGPIGGIETRAWMFARELGRRDDVSVSFAVRHASRPHVDLIDNVHIVPIVDRLYRVREAVRLRVGKRDGFPWLALHSWSNALLWEFPLVAAERLLRGRPGDPWRPDPFISRVPADLFCTFGVQSHSATVIASAHATGRPAVLMLGSDGDLDARYVAGSTFVSPYGDRGDVCYRILSAADEIVAQTEEQQRVVRDRFGRDAHVIANPIDVEEWDARRRNVIAPETTAGLTRYVLWVGRAEPVHKRPQVLLELARLCPGVDFLMILNPRDAVFEQGIRRDAPANVRIVRQVPFADMPAVFARAAALVNTSSLEGFPNVFLQAAISGVPIASLEVGRGFLAELGCGCCGGGDVARLAAFVREMWDGGCPDRAALSRARDTVTDRHGLRQRSDELAGLLRDAAARHAHGAGSELPA
jgi:glycosyltransferase involved in cell wall biosynthesis